MKANTKLRCQLHITAEAWSWITQSAYALGYVRTDKLNRGVGLFLHQLSRVEYIDARPEDMQSTDQWSAGIEPGMVRIIVLDAADIMCFAAIARQYRIAPFRSQNPVRNGRSLRIKRESVLTNAGDTVLVAPVLEAIGLRWLVPTTTIMPAPSGLWARPPRRRRSASKNVYTFLDF